MKGLIRFALAFGVLAVAMVGATSASAGNGGTDRPWKASGTMIGPVDFTTLNFSVEGTAIGAHYGKGTVQVDGNLLGGFVSKTTAANGDTITFQFASQSGDLSGILCPAGFVAFKNYQDVTGGTGRFAGASGTVLVGGCFGIDDNATLTITFTASGAINY